MTLATLLVQIHGQDRMEAVYFWSAILIVLLPVSLFATLGVWLWKKYRKERAAN